MSAVPATGYRWRTLTPEQRREARRLRGDGVPIATIAARYGCSQRTVRRCVAREDEPVRELRVGSWRASFELTDCGPVQVTPWTSFIGADR